MHDRLAVRLLAGQLSNAYFTCRANMHVTTRTRATTHTRNHRRLLNHHLQCHTRPGIEECVVIRAKRPVPDDVA